MRRAVLLVVIGSSACRIERAEPPRASIDNVAVETAVRAELDRYYRDFSARDWSAFADHFWSGATLTTVWQPPGAPAARVDAQTVPAFVAQAPSGPGSKEIFEERLLQAEVRVHRNLATAWARYQARFGDPGQVVEWGGIDAITLMEQGGRWRITSIAFTDLDGQATGRAVQR